MGVWKQGAAWLGVLLALLLGVQAQAQVPLIETYLDDAFPASGAPGMAYAVVKDGAVQSGARGEVLLGSGEAVTPDTPFLLGSISKSFTALAVMQIVEAGEVELDAPISRYLTEFGDGPAGAITIRQLLSHTSGYSTLQGNDRHLDRTGSADELAQSVARSAQAGPDHAPGTRYEYSNANYRMLGRVVEVVTGSDFATYVETNILQPLGMANSFVSDGQDHPQMATGHTPWFWSKRAFEPGRTHRINAPAGGIVASANDMALYLAMMMNGEDDILSAKGKAMMMRPASPVSPGYGFGWMLIAGGETAYHTGTSPGVETQASMAPGERLGVIALVNSGSGFGVAETHPLTAGVAATAFGLPYEGNSGQMARFSLFAMLLLAPLLLVACIGWALKHRAVLRAKRKGRAGRFSLWFPLAAMAGVAVILLLVVPGLFGVPLRTLLIYLPDAGLLMIATAALGLIWAAARLAIAYSRAR